MVGPGVWGGGGRGGCYSCSYVVVSAFELQPVCLKWGSQRVAPIKKLDSMVGNANFESAFSVNVENVEVVESHDFASLGHISGQVLAHQSCNMD